LKSEITGERQFTWPEVRYWTVGLTLVFGGAAAAIWGDDLPEWAQRIAKELGPGIFTAGILALLVEPFFRKEFARDAFLAAFRYVLPEAFKDEVAKILTYNFICEEHLWTVTIKRIDDDAETVLVTTTFERVIRNRTSSEHKRRGYYTIIEFNYKNRVAKVLECAIESEQQKIEKFKVRNHADWLEASTEHELSIRPNETAKLSGKAEQYRRVNDMMWETFTDPIVNPKIQVNIDHSFFDHRIEFGTKGDVQKAKYDSTYTLSAVYFPGQFMNVRWWPKSVHPRNETRS
jgi:hypothetical protein